MRSSAKSTFVAFIITSVMTGYFYFIGGVYYQYFWEYYGFSTYTIPEPSFYMNVFMGGVIAFNCTVGPQFWLIIMIIAIIGILYRAIKQIEKEPVDPRRSLEKVAYRAFKGIRYFMYYNCFFIPLVIIFNAVPGVSADYAEKRFVFAPYVEIKSEMGGGTPGNLKFIHAFNDFVVLARKVEEDSPGVEVFLVNKQKVDFIKLYNGNNNGS